MFLPTCLTVPISIILRVTLGASLKIRQKYYPYNKILLMPFKVIETHTDRSATYDFLLAIPIPRAHLVPFPIDKRRFRWKPVIFPTPVAYLTPPPLREFTLEFCNVGSARKNWCHALMSQECHCTLSLLHSINITI